MSEHQVSNRNRRSIPQLDRLCALLGPVLEHNAFYRQKLNAAGIQRHHRDPAVEGRRHVSLLVVAAATTGVGRGSARA